MIPFILAGVGGYLLGSSDESKKFANGGMTNDTYEVKIDNSYIDIIDFNLYLGVKDIDVDTSSSMRVSYSLYPEVRSWGIKSIDIIIESVAASVSWEVYLEDISEEDKNKLIKKGGKIYGKKIEGELEMAFKSYKDWTIESSELTFEEDGSFSIGGAEIDFKDKTVHLQK